MKKNEMRSTVKPANKNLILVLWHEIVICTSRVTKLRN